MVSPGSMYGPSGEGFFRISLTTPDERISEAVERLREHLAAEMAERRRRAVGIAVRGRYGFCRAVRDGDRVIVSGTAPIWPDGTCDPDPAAQARRCCEIIVAALEELGASPPTCTHPDVRDRRHDRRRGRRRSTASSSARPRPRRRWSSSPACSIPAGWSRSRPRPRSTCARVQGFGSGAGRPLDLWVRQEGGFKPVRVLTDPWHDHTRHSTGASSAPRMANVRCCASTGGPARRRRSTCRRRCAAWALFRRGGGRSASRRRRRLGPARRRDVGRAALPGPGRDRRRAGADRLPGDPLLSATSSRGASGWASAAAGAWLPPAVTVPHPRAQRRLLDRHAGRSRRCTAPAPSCSPPAPAQAPSCHGVVLGLASGLLIGVSNVAIKALTEGIDVRGTRAGQPVDRARGRRRLAARSSRLAAACSSARRPGDRRALGRLQLRRDPRRGDRVRRPVGSDALGCWPAAPPSPP